MFLLLRSVLTILAVLGFTVSVSPSGAQAEVFYWQDAGTNMSVSFPDTWRMIHDQKPSDVLTIAAPSDGAFPLCRMRVKEDRRFVVYPQRYSRNIQHVAYSADFWQDYAGEFARAHVDEIHDDAGLGRGFASYAYISYVPDAGPRMKRRGLVFASLYRDKAYVLECSAEASTFNEWHNAFLRIAASVDFRKEIDGLPGSMYRNFPGDNVLRINGPAGSVSYH